MQRLSESLLTVACALARRSQNLTDRGVLGTDVRVS